MEAKTVKNIIVQKRFLKYSVWRRFIKRKVFELKRMLWKSEVKITPFIFKNWGDIHVTHSSPPENTGWKRQWHGYFEMEKTYSKKHEALSKKMHTCDKGISGQELRKQSFLSITNEIKDNQINMFELGAGTAKRCLELAGTVDFNLVPTVQDKTYRCLAVEAEPTHYSWAVLHFEKQHINGSVVHGAIADKSGYVNFETSQDPATFYGQTVIEWKGDKVNSFTVDELIEKYHFPKINFIHADVQGSELKAVWGAKKSIEQGLIDYWFISTHQRYLEEEIIKYTKNFYDTILYIPHRSGLVKHDFYGWVFVPQDGLLILRHKNLRDTKLGSSRITYASLKK